MKRAGTSLGVAAVIPNLVSKEEEKGIGSKLIVDAERRTRCQCRFKIVVATNVS